MMYGLWGFYSSVGSTMTLARIFLCGVHCAFFSRLKLAKLGQKSWFKHVKWEVGLRDIFYQESMAFLSKFWQSKWSVTITSDCLVCCLRFPAAVTGMHFFIWPVMKCIVMGPCVYRESHAIMHWAHRIWNDYGIAGVTLFLCSRIAFQVTSLTQQVGTASKTME